MDFSELRKNLVTLYQLEKLTPIVVGVSGGPDSLCLLHFLVSNGFICVAAHLDHQLRTESGEDAQKVINFCELHGIKSIIKKVDVENYSHEKKLSVEEAGREIRYQFLFEIAKKIKAQVVMVGHNADDQVETILMHLLRGSGVSGLKGIRSVSYFEKWDPTIPLIRPFLGIFRSQIEQYCIENQLEPVHDISNLDPGYFRNRIRVSLIPELQTYNPRIKEHLLTLGEVVKLEDQILVDQTDKLFGECVESLQKGYVVFRRNNLQDLPVAILRRLVKRTIELLDPDFRNLDYPTIHQASNFILGAIRPSELTLTPGVSVMRYRKDRIIIFKQKESFTCLWPQLAMTFIPKITIPGEMDISKAWKLVCGTGYLKNIRIDDQMVCHLDAAYTQKITLDSWKNGDRFTPMGMEGRSIKLGDFWTNEGLPVRARKNWPLIKIDGEIAWVPGFRVSENYKISEHTKNVLHFSVVKTIK